MLTYYFLVNFDKKYNWYMPTQTPNPTNLNRIPSHVSILTNTYIYLIKT